MFGCALLLRKVRLFRCAAAYGEVFELWRHDQAEKDDCTDSQWEREWHCVRTNFNTVHRILS